MAIANVVINSKTYTPVKNTGSKIDFVESSGGIPTGFGKLSMELRQPNGSPSQKDSTKGSPYRVQFILDTPVVATDDSTCACAGTVLHWERVRVDVEISSLSDTAERTDNALRLKDLMANGQVLGILENLVMPA